MKFQVKKLVDIDVKYIRLNVAVRYDDDDMPYDFPFRIGDIWEVTIDAEAGKILDWPEGVSHSLHMKVCDCGSYYLLDENKEVLGSREGNYVPDCIPGSYGDYIEMDVASDGTITNWNKNFDVGDFFEE